MSIKDDLKNFYDKYAKKYYETRKKYWLEGNIIIDEIKRNNKKHISILEFGCGSGRFISFLNDKIDGKKVEYIGIDISKNLIKYAKKDNPENKFICADISEYIEKLKQESFDYIIGTESFQHIPSEKERFFLMKNFYRILKYDGKIIMTNRSLSNWFIKKYSKNILNSLLNFLITFGKKDRKDIYIPRKNDIGKDYRFYHIFSIQELENLALLSGFIINHLGYIGKDQNISSNKNHSKSSILIGSKSILKE